MRSRSGVWKGRSMSERNLWFSEPAVRGQDRTCLGLLRAALGLTTSRRTQQAPKFLKRGRSGWIRGLPAVREQAGIKGSAASSRK